MTYQEDCSASPGSELLMNEIVKMSFKTSLKD